VLHAGDGDEDDDESGADDAHDDHHELEELDLLPEAARGLIVGERGGVGGGG